MNLKELEGAILDQARSEMACPDDRKAELLARINQQISVGAHPPVDELGLPRPASILPGKLPALWGTSRPIVGLMTGALVGGALGYFLGLSQTESPQGARVNPTVTLVEKATLPLPPLDGPEPEPTKAKEAIVHQPKTRPGIEEGSTVVSPAKQERAPKEEQALYRELTYLKQAQSALRQNKPAMAYGLMTSLDESHPHGALLVERSVTKVLALCALDRDAEARELYEALKGAAAGAPYLERLEASCVAASPLEQTDPDATRHQ